ncbi:MAG TPA: protein phosphatase 2C domain-containing protein [Ktedonobacteraceae bacterium]
MEHEIDGTSLLTLETDQATETFTRECLGKAAAVRLFSARCQEAQAQGLPGQDYARIVSKHEGASVCFCVCDGVGSSYKGDFAARYLAVRLVDWLQTLAAVPKRPGKISRVVQSLLDCWAPQAQRELAHLSLPLETPELVREVLEDLRDTYGSETVFFCGRIDRLRKSSQAGPAHCIRALFCWMGNISACLVSGPGLQSTLGDQSNDRNRWSTARGCRGKVSSRVCVLDTLDSLLIHTDGLDSIAEELIHFDDAELQLRIQQLLRLPANDDMTLLEVRWLDSISEKGDGL